MSETAILPQKAHSTDAGFDLFYAGTEVVTIPPFGNVKLGTGWRMEIPEGWCLLIKNRSGVATKKGLLRGAELCDYLYDGEIIVNLHNPKLTPEIIEPGMKIAQFILVPVPECEIEEVDESVILNQQTKRGSGGFGSTGF